MERNENKNIPMMSREFVERCHVDFLYEFLDLRLF